MRVLTKHQKKGEEGFKNYVKFLESSATEKVKDVIALGMLEDPVYLKWALANIMNFDYIMTLEDDHITKITQSMNNAVQSLIFAFYKTANEEQFIADKLNMTLRRQYKEEKEFLGEVKKSQQDAARRAIVTVIRKLQDNRDIPVFKWNLPNAKILKGENWYINPEGKYVSNYEDGTHALRGQLENKLRTGTWEHYYPNGKMMAFGTYVEDDKIGRWLFSYANGNKKAEGDYKENLRQGEWLEYDHDGNEKKVLYERGKIIT